MSDTEKTDDKKPLSLKQPGRLELRKTVESGEVRQSFSHGRSKTVTVEVKRKRMFKPDAAGGMAEVKSAAASRFADGAPAKKSTASQRPAFSRDQKSRQPIVLKTLTTAEKSARASALESARVRDREAREKAAEEAIVQAERDKIEAAERDAADTRASEEEDRKRHEEEFRLKAEEDAARRLTPEEEPIPPPLDESGAPKSRKSSKAHDAEEGESRHARHGKGEVRRSALAPRRNQPRRRSGKMTISQALSPQDRMRSMASVRRAREREKAAQRKQPIKAVKIVHEVVVPDSITVQELANRMAVRAVDVIKALMKMGVMATTDQVIDGETSELLIEEFGHTMKRVSDADVEIGLKGEADDDDDLVSRPPVVTVMGHVDHGKTSLLDALRRTDVVSGEAGGITQHIGAYQVTLSSGARISFLDTPGHAAFTAMRSRGAKATDIVVLVVAANDSVMPQTVEAINHAKAAKVPIIIAINKIDLPDADADRVRQDLLQHDLVVESLGGDILCVELSAKEGTNLDKLEEVILLQAEILDLQANPNRSVEGVVIEATLEPGRGAVATILVQRGTLRVGDIVVAGGEWGRVRAMLNDRGETVDECCPGSPVVILGLGGVPDAGDEVVAVENERRAREVTEYRQAQVRELRAAAASRSTLEQMFTDIAEGTINTLPIVIKGDVHGSIEAISGNLEKLATDEVAIQILHAGVGGINESDVTLAEASHAPIIGFNVRANAAAKKLARRDNVEIRYYSVIYDLLDDLKAALSGLLAPTLREKIVANARVLEVFDITKVGNIAGCRVIDGLIKRASLVRLLRDDKVIFEGKLSTLRRFKDDAREVKEGLECGIAFENYHDIRIGDIIEAYEIEEIARTL